MKTIKKIICAVVGHKMWKDGGIIRVYHRSGRRFTCCGLGRALCDRCSEFYIVEETK